MKLVETFSLSKDWGGETVLSDVTFSIQSGDRIGLIGRNGCGKTTLLHLITGGDRDYRGTLRRGGGCRIAMVDQYIGEDLSLSVSGFLLSDIEELNRRLRELEEDMSAATGKDLEAVLASYQETREHYDGLAGDSAESRMERLLEGAGLTDKASCRLDSLSGGERNTLGLLRAMMELPDLLLLDEPGNHLDYAGLAWLEKFLSEQRGAVLIVSHNRYLLDRVADRIWELEDGVLTEWQGNYSAYRLEKMKALGAAGKLYKAQQRKIARLEELVRRFEEAARNTADPAWGQRLKARRTQLEREKEAAVDKPKIAVGSINPDFSGRESRADIAIEVSDYSRCFGDLELFHEADLFIAGGERVALIGPNGSGKSTFLNDLVREGHWDNPVIRIGPSMVIGYCAQHQEVFDHRESLAGEFEKLAPGTRDEVYRFLSRFSFSWNDLDRPIASLSGGERNRLQIARAIYLKANLLILDEPTNHLDIASREAIENGIEDFTGTLLVVSHDRYFLDKAADRVIEIQDRKFVEYDGNFSEYWALKRALHRQGAHTIARRAGDLHRRQAAGNGGRRQEDLEAMILRLEKEQRNLEERIEQAYQRGDFRKGGDLSAELERVTVMIDRAYNEWGQE